MKSPRFLVLFFLLSLFTTGGCATGQSADKEIRVRGVVMDTSRQPVAGVVVTDGVNFTQTDQKGLYQLSSNPARSKFVYISVPADYKAPVEKALPTGYYAPIDAKRKNNHHDFVLEKREQPLKKFAFIAISDPQVKNDQHLARFTSETVTDLKETLNALAPQEVYGMVLGDIVWDAMPLFDSYKAAIAGLNMTTYHVIGNHDFDEQYPALSIALDKNEYGEHAFGSHFGPTDYSFNIGKIHIISMKDIDYRGGKKYKEQFTPEQLEWLKKDLSYVQPGTTVFLNLHAPTSNRSVKADSARNSQQLYDILKDYRVHIFAGHTHFYENRIVTPHFYEHNIGAACGAWWAGNVNCCGAPNGYLVVQVDGEYVTWQYKATGRPANYQFRVYKPGEFKSQSDYLVVNLWDYDPAWKLTYYENGVEKPGVLESFADEDQDYITMKEGKARGYHTLHLFRVRPTSAARSVKIVATNRFGKSFTETVNL
ncbi:calcineurin-like phosphoesterase C-terminal domain-containing protein [Bacteroides sp.]|uniref:calcineurin-like phosphoesterase C-terminal domain-containing protein n=1 Tax=Bacteroides sp. TaxID=29523 RepID=UPI003AB32C75